MRTSADTERLDAALSAAQAELQNPHKSKTAKMKGKSRAGNEYEISYSYADIADVLTDARPVLAKHKIAMAQATAIAGGALILVTRLSHDGQWIEGDYPVCTIGGDHQEMGKGMTYARRYALTAMLGIAAEDDTDGEGAARSGAPANGSARPAAAPPPAKPASNGSATLDEQADRLIRAVQGAGTADEVRELASRAGRLHTDLQRERPARVPELQAAIDARLSDLEPAA